MTVRLRPQEVRCAPLTKAWQERFALQSGAIVKDIMRVVEPGDTIRTVDTRGDYYHRWGTAEPGGVAVSGSAVFPILLQSHIDSVARMNEREANERFRLSVFREFVSSDVTLTWEEAING